MRGGLAQALAYIRQSEGLSYKKAKRRFIRKANIVTSPGLQALARKQRGLPYGLKADRLKPAEAKVWRVTYPGSRPVSVNEDTGVVTVG